MFYRILLISIVFLTFSTDSHAVSCYSAVEAEAEQGIRIHSELMVIGLNCQHMTPRGWKNFYMQYREFANRNAPLFSEYEQKLINFFQEEGRGDAEKQLHDLRTNFANKVSKDAATMRPDIFCATYAPRIPKVANMSQAELRNWAATSFKSHPASRPVCR